MRRTLITIIALVVAMSALAPGAMAQEEDAPQTAGRLWAFGTGTAQLDVDRGAIKLFAVGDVTITGPAGLDIVIDSWTGPEPAQARSDDVSIELTNFSGSISVKGADYEVTIDGVTVLHGAGFGEATFSGEGLWKTRRNQGTWPGAVSLSEQDAA